jgi:hypothetical protein
LTIEDRKLPEDGGEAKRFVPRCNGDQFVGGEVISYHRHAQQYGTTCHVHRLALRATDFAICKFKHGDLECVDQFGKRQKRLRLRRI